MASERTPASEIEPPETATESAIFPMQRRSSRSERLAAALELAGSEVLRWVWVSVLVALAPGLTLFTLLRVDAEDLLVNNQLSVLQRAAAVRWMLTGAVVVAAVYVAHAWWRRKHGERFDEACVRLNHFAFVISIAPLTAALLRSDFESRNPLSMLVIIWACAAVVAVFAYRASMRLSTLHLGLASGSRFARFAPWCLLAVLGGAYATYFAQLSLLDHRNFGTGIYDLGIYDNVVWRTANGDFLGCSYCKGGQHASAHFDPILILLVPFYKAWPSAETLLVFQSAWLALGVIPLYLIARNKLDRPFLALILPAMYALYPALHGANMFDFHSLTLAAPLMLWALHLLDVGRVLPYFVVLALLLMVREDMSLWACFIGVYAILARRPIMGLATTASSLAYLAAVKLFWMPDSGLLMAGKGTMAYADFYEDMIPFASEGVRGMLISLLTNPAFVIKLLLVQGKVFYFGALLVPLLFLPLFSGRKLFTMLYGLIFLGLASRPYVYQLSFQYSVTLFPALFAAVPDAIKNVSRSRIARAFDLSSRGLVSALLCASLFATALCSIKLGGIVQNDFFEAGWTKLDRDPSARTLAWNAKVDALLEKIPKDAVVSSTTWLGPHLSNRRHVYRWPKVIDATHVVIDVKGMDKAQRLQLATFKKSGFRHSARAGSVHLFVRETPAASSAPKSTPGHAR